MAVRRALVLIDGKVQETPTGDTLYGSSGGGGSDPYNPASPVVMVDDFLFNSAETGEIGQGWSFTNGSCASLASEQNRPGIVRRTSGTTANQVASFYPGSAAGSGFGGVAFSDLNEMLLIVRLPSADTAFSAVVGLSADWSTNGSHGLWLEKQSGTTNWSVTTRNNSSASNGGTIVAASTSWVKFRIRRISATQVGFTADTGTEIVMDTASGHQIPDATDILIPGVQITPTTTTAKSIDLDFIALKTGSLTR